MVRIAFLPGQGRHEVQAEPRAICLLLRRGQDDDPAGTGKGLGRHRRTGTVEDDKLRTRLDAGQPRRQIILRDVRAGQIETQRSPDGVRLADVVENESIGRIAAEAKASTARLDPPSSSRRDASGDSTTSRSGLTEAFSRRYVRKSLITWLANEAVLRVLADPADDDRIGLARRTALRCRRTRQDRHRESGNCQS